MPIAGVVAGGVLLAIFLRRQTARRSEHRPAPQAAPADAEIERLVDEEFRRAKGEA